MKQAQRLGFPCYRPIYNLEPLQRAQAELMKLFGPRVINRMPLTSTTRLGVMRRVEMGRAFLTGTTVEGHQIRSTLRDRLSQACIEPLDAWATQFSVRTEVPNARMSEVIFLQFGDMQHELDRTWLTDAVDSLLTQPYEEWQGYSAEVPLAWLTSAAMEDQVVATTLRRPLITHIGAVVLGKNKR